MQVDLYTASGYALELLANSRYHCQFNLSDYFSVEILPPLRLGHIRYYLAPEGIPTAMVTWARLSEDVEKDICATGRALRSDEWNCGSRLFCNDWITPFGNLREIVHDISSNMFPDEVATSLRRRPDGSVRRVNRWTGANLRRKTAGFAA